MASNSIIANLIEINAIKLSPLKPFTWASGWLSPIYCDNRKILSFPQVREQICKNFSEIIASKFKDINVIAGVATGAIAHGVLVANKLDLPFVYVRSEPKKHGLENLIEGNIQPGQRVVVVEDLISTGLSSLKAVEALKNAGAEVLGMVAIFTYEFEISKNNFAKQDVPLYTLANYSQLIEHALNTGAVGKSQLDVLMKWRENPEQWGK